MPRLEKQRIIADIVHNQADTSADDQTPADQSKLCTIIETISQSFQHRLSLTKTKITERWNARLQDSSEVG